MKMQKKTLLMLVVIAVALALILLISNFSDGKYSTGRDTIKSFGEGRFQIIQMPATDEGKIRNVLYDLKEMTVIENDIYYTKEIDHILYVIGENGYCILKYLKENYNQSKDLADFTLEEQNIFNQAVY